MRGIGRVGVISAIVLLGSQVAVAQDEPVPQAAITDVPNAGRPLTHAELLAFRGEMADPDQFVTVVADATIERDAARGSEWGPTVGLLPRATHPGRPAVEATRRVRALYPADEPIEGLTAFHITQDILLRGTVHTPADRYLTPIEPAAMASASSLPPGALIVSRGWLARLDATTPCPEPPKELRIQRLGGGSPFLACPAGWLTAEPVTEPLSDPARPQRIGIRVQHGAAAYFDQGDDPGTYLLRRIPNPVQDAEPAEGWEVLSRLDAVDLPSSRSMTEAAAHPGGLDWTTGLERQPPADMHSPQLENDSFMTTWSGGYASVHQGRDRVASSWVSTDGRDWRSAELPRKIGRVDALLHLGDGLIIIADSRLGSAVDPDWRFDVWRSADGLRWRRVARQVFPAWDPYTPARGYQRIIEGFWSLGETIVAHETFGESGGAGGRVAGWDVVAADIGPPPTFAWTSEDGLEWEKRYVRGLDRGLGRHAQVRASGGELWSVSAAPDARIHHSANGVNWKRVGRGPDDLGQHRAWARLFTVTDEGYVLGGVSVGEREPDEPWRGNDSLWFSTDLRAWTRVASPPRGDLLAVAAAGDTVVAVGGSSLAGYDAGVDPSWSLMASGDGGRTWDASLTWESPEAWCPRSLVGGSGSIVLELACPPTDGATTYVLDTGS